jgi:hypothetical protein
MVDRPRLDQLLALLARYVAILRQLSLTPPDEFADGPCNYGSAERFLQLAIETVLSTGNHVIADAGFDQTDTYADIIVGHGLTARLRRAVRAESRPPSSPPPAYGTRRRCRCP